MELRDYIRILHKNWMLIVACVLIGVAGAAAFSILRPSVYEATTELYVSVQKGESTATGDLVQGTSFARQAVTSYVDVVDTAIVLEPVIEDLKLNASPTELAKRVTAESPLDTVLINITVSDKNATQAAKIANAIGEVFSTVVVEKLESPAGDAPSLVRIETIQPAVAPTSPVAPNVVLNLALGSSLGVALGVSMAFLRSFLDTRLHSHEDLEQVTKTPIIGSVTNDPDAQKRPLVVHVDPRNPRAEAFRAIRTNLQFVNVGETKRSYVVTSSIPGEGKSTTTANLAISLAETGAKVALIDGDLRLPRIAEYMGIEGSVGLTDVLVGRADLVDVLQRWGRGQLFVLPSGKLPPNPSELLGSAHMKNVLQSLCEAFDYVLIDAPPLLLVTDAAVISKMTSGAILVAAAGRVKKPELSSALRALDGIGSTLVGLIMTMVPTKGPDAYAYGKYGYGQLESVVELDPRKTSLPSRRSSRRRAS